MTARISIHIEAEDAGEAREQMARLLGQSTVKVEWRKYEPEADPMSATLPGTPLSDMPASSLGEAVAASPEGGEWAEKPEAPKRERGQPSPGRARRTKAEIVEDELAGASEEPKANISTGEERIDPTTPEDAAQDAADEAAEAETTKAAELTHDDVRAALKKYLDAYGTAAAMEDGPKVLKMMFGDTAAKVSDVPGDQDSLAKAIAGIDEMLGKNPFKREAQL